MLLGTPQQTKTEPSEWVKKTTEATFMADVVEASMETPVIVDFWAPWCGPCKTLGPQLETEVNARRGKVLMVKINVDENPSIASQLQVQSIPTVYGFFEGKPVDAFQGAIPQSEIKQFVQKLVELGDDGGLAAALEAAELMLEEGDCADAAETFAAVTEEEPENAAAWGGLIRARLASDQIDAARDALAQVPAVIENSGPVEVARAQLALADQAAEAGPVGELQARVEADPDDHEARLEYARALHAEARVEEAIDQLLEGFRRDREWQEGAFKTQLLTVLDSLKPTDPVQQKGRRRLSSMIFV